MLGRMTLQYLKSGNDIQFLGYIFSDVLVFGSSSIKIMSGLAKHPFGKVRKRVQIAFLNSERFIS